MAQDDLRYPDRMVASEHFERPISTLQPGVGAMPGKTPTEKAREATHTDGLISGRGLIP